MQPVRPGDYIDSSTLVADLERLLDGRLVRASSAPPFFLHVEKANRCVHELLRDRGLASWPPGTQPRGRGRQWIAVDGDVGALYVAYLAAFICQDASLDMEPITDRALNFEAVAGCNTLAVATSLDHLRAAILRDVLPAPAPMLESPSSSISRTPMGDCWPHFVARSRLTYSHARGEPNPELRRRMCLQLSGELSERADEAERRMFERHWPTKRGVIAFVAGAAAASPVASGQPEAAIATGAAPLLIDWLRSRFGAGPHDRAGVYAVLAAQEFGSRAGSADDSL